MVFGIGGKTRKKKHAKVINPGRAVKIVGSVGVRDDDDPGGSLELKGETGVLVEGRNCVYEDKDTGEVKQLVQLDDGGGLIGVPARTLKEIRGRRR